MEAEQSPVYPPTGVWDCARSKTDGREDSFYDLFRKLPYELKIHCLSFAGFHTLVNTELWLRDTDRLHFRKQVVESQLDYENFDLFIDVQRLYIGFAFPFDEPYSGPHIGGREQPDMEARFGRVNRYTSCYYRKCAHFDDVCHGRQPTAKEVIGRWRRLHKGTATTRGSSVRTVKLLRHVSDRLRRSDLSGSDSQFMYSRWPTTIDPFNVRLEPGAYYWELVNHNWEKTVSDVEGEGSRQNHFRLDLSGESHEGSVGGFVCMSLMYRRVVHPTVESNDVFTNLAYFYDRCSLKGMVQDSVVYFGFGEQYHAGDHQEMPDPTTSETESDDDDLLQNYVLTYPVRVYRHSLTPAYGIELERAVDPENGSGAVYYKVTLPENATLYSLDRNKTTVRLNFYVETRRLTHHERSSYGASIAAAVCSNVDRGYAFMPTDNTYVDERSEEVFRLFKKGCM